MLIRDLGSQDNKGWLILEGDFSKVSAGTPAENKPVIIECLLRKAGLTGRTAVTPD